MNRNCETSNFYDAINQVDSENVVTYHVCVSMCGEFGKCVSGKCFCGDVQCTRISCRAGNSSAHNRFRLNSVAVLQNEKPNAFHLGFDCAPDQSQSAQQKTERKTNENVIKIKMFFFISNSNSNVLSFVMFIFCYDYLFEFKWCCVSDVCARTLSRMSVRVDQY